MNNQPLTLQLLFVLLRHTGHIPLQKLAQKLGCSESTVLRRIEEAQSLLPDTQGVFIEVSRARGCCLVGERQAVWDIIAQLREKKFFMMWRSREERQFLILMHLLCTRGTSKLSVLGTATHVAAATVLEDIRRLNAFLHPVFIDSRPGAGTKIIGDAAAIQRKIMEYCYSALSPINFVALACGRKAFSQDKICPCASEIFLNLIREKVPIPRIIESINTWETRNNIMFSDLAFSNVLIYLIILHLRVNAHLHVVPDDDTSQCASLDVAADVAALLPDGAHAGEAQLLARFLLGLEEDVFTRHCAQQKMQAFRAVCQQIVACVARHETIVQTQCGASRAKAADAVALPQKQFVCVLGCEVATAMRGAPCAKQRTYARLVRDMQRIGLFGHRHARWGVARTARRRDAIAYQCYAFLPSGLKHSQNDEKHDRAVLPPPESEQNLLN